MLDTERCSREKLRTLLEEFEGCTRYEEKKGGSQRWKVK